MMTWAETRLTVNQIKAHPFFYGADWSSLRHIEPPFVPQLQSITDTSYFPTDDLGNMPDHLERVEGVGAEKDLAFLGWVVHLFQSLPFFANLRTGSLSNASLVELKHLDELFLSSVSFVVPLLRPWSFLHTNLW